MANLVFLITNIFACGLVYQKWLRGAFPDDDAFQFYFFNGFNVLELMSSLGVVILCQATVSYVVYLISKYASRNFAADIQRKLVNDGDTVENVVLRVGSSKFMTLKKSAITTFTKYVFDDISYLAEIMRTVMSHDGIRSINKAIIITVTLLFIVTYRHGWESALVIGISFTIAFLIIMNTIVLIIMSFDPVKNLYNIDEPDTDKRDLPH